MPFEHQGMKIWVEPDKRIASGDIDQGSDVNLTVGVEPADASNRVQVKYSVNGGPATAIDAAPLRHVGNAQLFQAQLPCATLCDGDTLQYRAVCQCAGRQVPSVHEAEQFSSSLQVINGKLVEAQPILSRAMRGSPSAKTFSTLDGPRAKTDLASLYSLAKPVGGKSQLKPTHLSLFVLEKNSGSPIARIPFYAEIMIGSVSQRPVVECQLEEVIRSTLQQPFTRRVPDSNFYPSAFIDCLCKALSRLLAQQTINRLTDDPVYAASIIKTILQKAEDLVGDKKIDLNDGEALCELAEDAVGASVKEHELPLREGKSQLEQTASWTHPLGVLATDHVGYLSFDLTRLPADVADAVALTIEARRRDATTPADTSIWIYPMGREEGRIDALSQMRFAHDAIVVKLELDMELDPILCQPKFCDAIQHLGILAMQNPNLTDWRLSPASFAANPSSLIGEDGCEQLFPAQIALQEFIIRQVVRLADAPPEITVPEGFKAAYVDEYKVSWHSLGHSLGQVLYSLPLAPGESVKLAVIDWSWDSLTERNEQTKLTEEVLHQTHRDRTITETVKAGLKEMQHGSSFMGGVATSAGAAGSYAGIGGAIGNAWSIGGSTATSEGSRELVGENVQRLSDSFAQASSSQRELNSTVVIQARQEEHESIQTRTFSNYNHSHTLTILYYEVLRHFKMTVECVRRRPAVLAKIPPRIDTFDTQALIGHRFLLEPALLDSSLKPAFDFLEKQETIREYYRIQGITTSDEWITQFWEGDIEFHMFEIGINTHNSAEVSGDDTSDSPIVGYVVTVDDAWDSKRFELQYVYKGNMMLNDDGNAPHNINSGQRFNEDGWQWIFVKVFDRNDANNKTGVKWKDIVGFQFEKWGDDDWRIDHLAITAFGKDGWSKSLTEGIRDVDLYFLGTEPSANSFTWIQRPGPRPALLPPPHRSPEKTLAAEEVYLIKKLLAHFELNKDYYNRVILLSTDPVSISMQFESQEWLAANADPYPLEVSGSYIAYPLGKVSAQFAVNSEKSERLMTLPTRGVFAEGKLGHCNLSEEIDENRFWRWDEHPIPFEAPGINPVTPVTPQPQQTSIAPTAFPQSLVNIVNPSTAPDPAGLTAALNALATANIFRDMSGQAQVADLLKKLSDNSVAIASVAQQAASGGKGGTAGSGSGGGASGSPAGNTGTSGGQSTTPSVSTDQNQPSSAPSVPQQTSEQKESQKIDNQVKKLDAADKLPPPQKKAVQRAVAKDLAEPSIKERTIEISLKGYANRILVGQWAWKLVREGKLLGFLPMEQYPEGRITIKFNDEFDNNRFRLDVTGEILAGYGINAEMLGRDIDLIIPPELYKTRDYYYVTLTATTGTFKTKASSSDEVTKKFTEAYKLSPEVGYKGIIKVTGEGGWTWEREGKKSAGKEMEMEVTFYSGGFTVAAIN